MAYCISITWSGARPNYEIYVIEISVSQEERKMDFSNFPQGLKVLIWFTICSWYKYLIVSLFFSHLGFWSGNLFSDCAFS